MSNTAHISLTVVTPHANAAWLNYVLDQFKRIQKAEFNIILSTNAPNNTESPLMYYGLDAGEEICIPADSNNRNFSLEKTLKILQNSTEQFPEDALRMAFVALSRIEEYDLGLAGVKMLSYSARHPSGTTEQFDKPYVNLLFEQLEHVLKKRFPQLVFAEKNKPVLAFSHDLDYIKKTIQLRLKQTVFNAFNTIKSITSPSLFLANLKKTFTFFFSSPSYWCFDYWEELESRFNVQSTYYIYAKTGSKNLKSWLIDPSYDIARNSRLQDRLKDLHSKGHQIGLHGSFNSAVDIERLHQEKETLEKALGLEIVKTRQHWLRFDETSTPHIHEELFEFDATLGWNDRMGYRAGCASLYQPFDHKSDRAFEYTEIPTVLMDSSIYDYGAHEVKEQSHKALGMIQELTQLKNAHVAISWHPRVCSSDYNWHPVYEKLMSATH